jgi:hypothetical protein
MRSAKSYAESERLSRSVLSGFAFVAGMTRLIQNQQFRPSEEGHVVKQICSKPFCLLHLHLR